MGWGEDDEMDGGWWMVFAWKLRELFFVYTV